MIVGGGAGGKGLGESVVGCTMAFGRRMTDESVMRACANCQQLTALNMGASTRRPRTKEEGRLKRRRPMADGWRLGRPPTRSAHRRHSFLRAVPACAWPTLDLRHRAYSALRSPMLDRIAVRAAPRCTQTLPGTVLKVH